YKEQPNIVAINSPKTFDNELEEMSKRATIIKNLMEVIEIEFVICFVTTQIEIEQFISAIYQKLKGDAVIWLCYPKMTSKSYKCDFNRDSGWTSLGKYNLEPVRQVAIDDDFSALRFRKVEFIKTITRRESFAITREAKKRTTQKGK
ncbi:MAG: hypothetical protein NWQ39_05260, partial [Saprospiraceae bacterium]|nr:hypothetical protein [Saprospiraceae bacterium]